jgi:sugar-specific transcriptional regulator TrmB
MSDLTRKEQQDELEKYLEEKAKQVQEKEQESKPLSAYDACVLKESAKIHELIAEAQKGSEDE